MNVHTFGTLISSASGELVAEHLHQRWLSDPNFAKIAADIVFQLHGVENRNVKVCSQVLALALRDFKSRRKIRKRSRHMFRNYFRTLVALYPVYRQIDKYLSACLIEPIFRCLQMLVDDSPDDSDLNCVANVMITSGQMLNQLNSIECDKAMMKCRKWLTSNSIQLEEKTKFVILHALDLWTYSWDIQSFPDCLRHFYEDHEREQLEMKRQQLYNNNTNIFIAPIKAASLPAEKRLSQPHQPLIRQPSVMDMHFCLLAKANKCDEDETDEDSKTIKKPNNESKTNLSNNNNNYNNNKDYVSDEFFEREESIV